MISPTPLDFLGIPIALQAVGQGAQTVETAADSQGLFAADVLPGLYDVVVDNELAEGIRVQNTRTVTLRVSVGKSVTGLSLDVARRVNVEGYLTVEGTPFAGTLAFNGPEVASMKVIGSFSRFLQPGDYTLYATTQFGAQRYALLEHLTISSPTNITELPTNVTSLKLAAVLRGALQVGSANLTQSLTLQFLREDGALLTTLTEESGEYEIPLSAGSYQASASWRGLDTLDGSHRFVHYSLDEDIELLSVGPTQLDLPVTRTLDNATVSGRILLSGQSVSARIAFGAANETAMSATFEVTGNYAVVVAPGIYDVYAYREIGKTVSLFRLGVTPYIENANDVILEPGLLVSGVADLQGTENEEVSLTFKATASANVTSDNSGLFKVYLPAGEYAITAATQQIERGVEIEYATETSLDLVESTTLNLLLERVDIAEVNLEWDESEKVTLLPGEEAVYTIAVENVGNVDDEYVFEGTPSDWDFEFSPSRIKLPFGHGNSATIQVTIKTPDDAAVEHSPVFIGATSASEVGVKDTIVVKLDIVHLRNVELRLSGQPPVLSPEALEYQIRIVNSGNGEDDFALTLLNSASLLDQGWRPVLIQGDLRQNVTVENITIPAATFRFVTLRLEAVGPVSTTKAFLTVHSQTDVNVRATLGVQLSFPSLEIPAGSVDVKGRNIQLTPAEFPFLFYGLIAAVGVIAALLFIRRRRARRRRR